jgi:hypothetical protein
MAFCLSVRLAGSAEPRSFTSLNSAAYSALSSAFGPAVRSTVESSNRKGLTLTIQYSYPSSGEAIGAG